MQVTLEAGMIMGIMGLIYGLLLQTVQILYLILMIFRMALVGLDLQIIPTTEVLEIGGITMELEIILVIYMQYQNLGIKAQGHYFLTAG